MRYLFYFAIILSIFYLTSSQSCLTFENVDNQILINDQVTIYVRNCGQNFTSFTVVITYLNTYDKKIVFSVAPNEVKPVTFKIILPLGITKTLLTAYAFNEETFIQSSFYVFKPESFVEIEVPEIKLKKGERKEILIKIINRGNFEVENILNLILPNDVFAYFEEEKVKILPKSEKYVKLTIYSKEFGKYEGVIIFGNFEKKFEINVEEKRESFTFPAIPNFVFLILLSLLLILLLVFLISKKSKKTDCYSILDNI